MILVSYHQIGAYNLYNPVKQKIEVSRGVIVCEANSWNCQDGASSSQNPSVLIQLQDVHLESEQNRRESNDEIEATTNVNKTQRPQRERHVLSKLLEYETLHDSEVTPDVNLVHFTLIAK